MNTTRQGLGVLLGLTLTGFFLVSSSGCVSSGTYQLAQKEAEDAQRELKKERDKIAAIEKVQAERKKQMDEWLAKLGSVVDRMDVIAKTFGDLRNEVTRLRISRELERGKASGISFALEGEPLLSQSKEEMQPKASVPSGDAKQRLKDLLQTLQGLMEQSEPRAQ